MTIEELLAEARGRLARAGVAEPEANAEFLLSSVLGMGRLNLRLDGRAAVAQARSRKFLGLIGKRAERIPPAYLLGSQNFMGLELHVTPDVLIPRPETEEVAQAALELVRIPASNMSAGTGRAENDSRPARILDIGTGSGCLAIFLARAIPQARVIAVDLSALALEVAEDNSVRHGLRDRIRFIRADLFYLPRFPEKMDIIVSNPPYIISRRIETLEPEVLREPRMALDGGPEGLDALAAIIRQVPERLAPGGGLVLEIDHGQGADVLELMRAAGLSRRRVRRDVNGLERVALAKML